MLLCTRGKKVKLERLMPLTIFSSQLGTNWMFRDSEFTVNESFTRFSRLCIYPSISFIHFIHSVYPIIVVTYQHQSHLAAWLTEFPTEQDSFIAVVNHCFIHFHNQSNQHSIKRSIIHHEGHVYWYCYYYGTERFSLFQQHHEHILPILILVLRYIQ